MHLSQLRVLGLGFFQDWRVGSASFKNARLHNGCRDPLDWLFRRSQRDEG